jgi:putative membrane protein
MPGDTASGSDLGRPGPESAAGGPMIPAAKNATPASGRRIAAVAAHPAGLPESMITRPPGRNFPAGRGSNSRLTAARHAMRLLLTWMINAATLLLIPYVLPGVKVDSFVTALVTALVLGLVNAVIRPILVLLTLPATLLTLGMFILVINALLFWFVAAFVEGFQVTGFWAAFWGALAYSIITTIAGWLVLPDKR